MPAGQKKAAAWRGFRRSKAMDIERLTYMANQIARNLAPQGEAAATELTYQHLRDFWDPRMKAGILGSDRQGLDPIARSAVDMLGMA